MRGLARNTLTYVYEFKIQSRDQQDFSLLVGEVVAPAAARLRLYGQRTWASGMVVEVVARDRGWGGLKVG